MSDPDRVKVDGDRHYRVDGHDYPSVTTITGLHPDKKKAIAAWEERVENPEEVKNRAALLGTLAHHRILNQYAIRELEPPEVDLSMVDAELEADIETCEALWEQCDFEVGDSPYIEQKVWNHEHEYAGTLDMLTRGTVVDLKTSKGVWESHKLQVAAYWKATQEFSDLPTAERGAVIKLHPDPENNPEMVPKVVHLDADELQDHFETFVQLRRKYERGGV